MVTWKPSKSYLGIVHSLVFLKFADKIEHISLNLRVIVVEIVKIKQRRVFLRKIYIFLVQTQKAANLLLFCCPVFI